MADGNFAIATDHEERYTGKFNDLLIGIRNMNRKIDDSLHQVEETAEQVSIGSGNMAEAAQSPGKQSQRSIYCSSLIHGRHLPE